MTAKEIIRVLCNQYAGRGMNAERFSQSTQFPGRAVDPKHHYITRSTIHIRAQQQLAIERDGQVLRCAAQARRDIDERQAAVIPDAVDGDAIMDAVGAVEIATIWRDFDVRCRGFAIIVIRQRRNCLSLDQGARIGIIAVDMDRTVHLIVGVCIAGLRMEGAVARATAAESPYIRLFEWRQLRRCRIE
jgi:hypothetical protein